MSLDAVHVTWLIITLVLAIYSIAMHCFFVQSINIAKRSNELTRSALARNGRLLTCLEKWQDIMLALPGDERREASKAYLESLRHLTEEN